MCSLGFTVLSLGFGGIQGFEGKFPEVRKFAGMG